MTWISVKDQLPDYGLGVLITDGETVTAAARCKSDYSDETPTWTAHGIGGCEWEFDFETRHVTHWMPLPEPPT